MRAIPARVRAIGVFAAIGLIMVACGGGSPSGPTDTSPIKIGLLLPLTGNFAPNGNDEQRGWDFALKDLGDTINGRKIQLVPVDDAGDPTQGLNAARRLVENDQVVGLFGPTTANEALALRSYVAASGVPMITVSSAEELATTQFSPNIMLGPYASDTPNIIFGKWVSDNMHLKKVTTIGLDFAFGWQSVGGFVVGLKQGGGGVEKQIWAPLTTADWSPYIAQIPSDSDGVFVLTSGAASIKVMAAYKQFGLLGKIPLLSDAVFNDYTVLQQEDPDVAKAAIVAGNYMDGLDNPENKRMAAAYKAQTGKYPGAYAEVGYTAALAYITALKKVNGNTKDRKAFVSALRAVKLNAPRGPVSWDSSTNAPIENIYIGKVQTVSGELRQVPTQTFKSVMPWGALSKDQWLKFACCYTRQSP
jgi:branched-chain amino acid transport system substrate-binding protein